MTAPLIPVTLLTGFLGSGKTTLLNSLLQLPELADSAVIINEFGAVAVDHLLVEQVSEHLRLLQSGCLCCTVRGDLLDTLQDLARRREDGQIAPFARVIIETTGLADPTPVLQTFLADADVRSRFQLSQIVTLVDAVNGAATLSRHEEARRQVALAQQLLISKEQLAAPAMVQQLQDTLRQLNPLAAITVLGEGAGAPLLQTTSDQALFAAAHWATQAGQGEEAMPSHHSSRLQTYCLQWTQPLPQQGLADWLERLVAMRGEQLLRVKGLVQLAEHPHQPTVIHGVQQLLHPFTQLPEWPDAAHCSRLVLIVDGISFSEIARTFERYVGVAVPRFQPAPAASSSTAMSSPLR
ncbi:GTP-binding protein [Pokkaliibacter sp. MBI-7]|uniref:CobW family GTP-binding protein n=1 Tax=Pokkaliibacter sp. MBI-7 TaxID=3040600 RepID=UPI002446EE5F|nr:GTP-binding protein [Pokkaliibacter sp. MBI-7]MDH2434346.1 GTP-binding protein [Pokkaliibacter sp. MBI-7]